MFTLHYHYLLPSLNSGKILHCSLIRISAAPSLHKPPPHTLSTLITCIMRPLFSLGIERLHDFASPSKTHIIAVDQVDPIN